MFALLLAKFKDKKTLVIELTKTTLDKFFFAINLEDVTQDLKEALVDKTPSMRIHTIGWIERYFESK